MSTGDIRHFLDLIDIPRKQLREMIETSRVMKKGRRRAGKGPLAGKTIAMIFDKPSTRTRVSFDVGIRQLGGKSITLTGQEMQLGRGETIADTARVLSRYVDAIMIRTLDHDQVRELAEHATVPVINGLTKWSHPCQVMADVLTFEEHRGAIKGRTVAWTGDANNVLTSWMHAADRFDFELRVATPPELMPQKKLLDWVKKSGAAIWIGDDPEEAVKGVDCVVTDTWVSMGDKGGNRRHNLLKPYQVNKRLMTKADPKAIFMHCLPAHRGEEVTDEVMDGPQSVVFDEAENRLHAQKGILAWCLHARRALTRGSSGGRVSAFAHYISRNDTASDRNSGARTGEDIRRRHRPAVRSFRSRSARPRRAAWVGGGRDSRASQLSPAGRQAARRGCRADRAARLRAEDRRPLHPADPDRRSGPHAGGGFPQPRERARLRAV